MAERLTLKLLSGELDVLRSKVHDLEQQLEHKLEVALNAAAGKLKSRLESNDVKQHGISIDTVHRQRLIEEEAYLIAERRGFQGGDPSQDWAEAESLVNYRLMHQSTAEKPVRKSSRKLAATKTRSKASSKTR